MHPTGEEPAGRRLALVIATGTYTDPTLARLRAPGRDASDLAEVLKDAAIGGFQVETVLDAPTESLRRRVARFCAQGGPRDLALVYLSCHGVLDDRGRLYYATTDTDHELLSATAVPSAWLNEQLEDCRCRRQILVLDCCHSGAFAKGAKGESGLALRERFEGRGRVVLTASRGTEYSFEGGRVVGDGVSSVFTGVLVEGLRSGDADRDRDGVITVTELYDYAYEAVRAGDARQTPTLWTYGAEGGLLMARSPRGAVVEPVPLPEDLGHLLESARPRVREGAVAELGDLLAGPDAGRALTARAHLERIAAEDIPRVANAARRALGAEHVAKPQPPPAKPGSAAHGPSRRTLAIVAGGLAVAVVAIAVALLANGSPPSSPPPSFGAIRVSGGPRGVAVGDGVAWVARHDDGVVSRIDATSRRVLGSVGVSAALDKIVAGEGSVWVSVGDGTGVTRIDPRERKTTATQRADTRREDCDCASLGLEIEDGALWVAAPDKGTITKRDIRTGGVIEPVLEPGAGFEGYFAVAGDAVWAVGRQEGDSLRSWLARIDPTSGKVDETFDLGKGVQANGVAFGEGAAWVADSADTHNYVIRFDPGSQRQTRIKIETGVSGDDIAVVRGSVLVWEPGGGYLTRIDARTNEVVATRRVSGYQAGDDLNTTWSELEVSGGAAWVTEPSGNAVHKLEY